MRPAARWRPGFEGVWPRLAFWRAPGRGDFVPLAAKLVLSYVLIVAVTAVAFGVVGARVIGNLIISEARSTVRNDLNAAREILLGRLSHVAYVVRFTADRSILLREALVAGRVEGVLGELARIREREGLDFLSLTDAAGRVLLRTTGGNRHGDVIAGDALLDEARSARAAVASIALMTGDALALEAPALAARAHIRILPTPRARPRAETDLTSGLVLKAVAPILDERGAPRGFLYGGILLNQNVEVVDKIKQTVFQEVQYRGRDIGTATLFLDDVRIATNVTNPDGTRAIGTRIAADVYDRVVVQGRPWLGRAYVVKDWYITAYEPIVGVGGRILGILYVGVLERKYVDLRRRTVGGFLALMLAGAAMAMVFSTAIVRRVSHAVHRLVTAARDVAGGNFDAAVDIRTNDELAVLAQTFNAMARSLRERDERLKELTRKKVMESERLAVVGQLAAGVAHELNNPLQGIVTYAHLLLERAPAGDPSRDGLQKIVTQAERCREIIRGLLDFARPRKPQVRATDVNAIIRECLALVERQAMFHNIEVVADLAPDLPPAIADPAQVQQVLMNLIINAAEAMNGRGRLTIATHGDAAAEIVEVTVSDTGHGIAPEDLDRIFDPFFTTKGVGRGTGLGLSISYGIIKEHRGTITVDSEVGRGSTFTIRLPATGLTTQRPVRTEAA